MSLFSLAFSNFRRSIREYAALILSLSFSVFIFFNFQNMVFSDSMDVLNSMKKEYIDMIIQAASVVFVVFLFFFIWYATNLFLKQRKKEIGIYTFMGLDNNRIGKMYAIEAFFIGLTALGTGLVLGICFSKLFQMVLLKLSDISVDIKFSFTLTPVLISTAMFFAIYGMMIGKGYLSIVRSSVLSMLSGARQQEMKRENRLVTAFKVAAGLFLLLSGYVCALRTGDISSLGYGLAAVILVIVGTYLLFGGAIPALIRGLTHRKKFLYQKQRTLWVNNLSYRIKRNYRTYAMVTVLMICSVTVLAMSIAMKQRYEKMVHFRETYTYQVMSSQELDAAAISRGISEENTISYESQVPYLILDAEKAGTDGYGNPYVISPYSAVKKAAECAGLDFPYEELKEGEVVELSHVIMMSFVNLSPDAQINLAGKNYHVIASDSTAYLGDIQSQMSTYMVNDKVYDKLKPLGVIWQLYNYKIEDPANAEASRPFLMTLSEQKDDQFQVGVNVVKPERNDEAWVRVMYSLCIFMFATLVLASGSIIFIKLNNEAYEDRERYHILKKLGIGETILFKSIKNEIRFTYYCPFFLMVLTSWFSVKALGNVMKEDLLRVNLLCAISILLLFTLIYLLSVRIFRKKVLD